MSDSGGGGGTPIAYSALQKGTAVLTAAGRRFGSVEHVLEMVGKLRAEIRYRIEWCPCTGVDEDYVQLEIDR